MTLFALRTADDLLTVRFAVSPVWETQAAVQALADERGHSYHESWLLRVQGRAARLDLAPLLGRTRARVLTALDQPISTSALAAVTGLSPAGASRHLLALRDAGVVSAARHGHEVRYRRTELGSALLHGRQENDRSAGRRPRR
jgi:DNA-binding transcriptional ArsR family regulator